jgi:hypothetical protein
VLCFSKNFVLIFVCLSNVDYVRHRFIADPIPS